MYFATLFLLLEQDLDIMSICCLLICLFVYLFVCVLHCEQSGGSGPEAASTAGGSEPAERGGLYQTCLLDF